LFLKTKWHKVIEKKPKTFKNILLGILESFRHRIASFDTLMQLTPFAILNLFKWLIVPFIIGACYYYLNGINNIDLLKGGTYLAKAINHFFSLNVNIAPGTNALFMGMLITIWFRLYFRIGDYLESIITPIYLFIIERKRIIKIPFLKKVLYSFTWPIFDIIGRYTSYVALFKKVTWKPIPHNSKITIEDLKK
jgi:hypothetical protein